MDINQAQTFLSIVAHGSFVVAGRHQHLTQSTISARIQRLEEEIGARLFVRNRSGASLTPAGRRFVDYAKRLVLTVEQAKDEIGLPDRFLASVHIGGRIALWDGFLADWVVWMRRSEPDVMISTEIGFEEDLMNRLIEGSLDVGLMYTPRHSPGLMVEHLFDEKLVLVSDRPDRPWPDDHYIHVDWGPGFYAQHIQNFPGLERPALSANIGWLAIQLIFANGGSCYLPERMATSLEQQKRLYRIDSAPQYMHPAYMVYPGNSDNSALDHALRGLRHLAAQV